MSGALQEHHGYISDPIRNQLFQQAVAQAVRPGDVVVDLGCGFGVLGLMCLYAGAARVYGIDRTDAIEIARETASRAGYGDRYHCIRDHSFRVILPEQVDVIICDHVGYFGFDYGIIEMVSDARRRFLKPGGRVIPGAITLQIAGISSETCRTTADAWATPQIPVEFHWLRDHGINSKTPYKFDVADLATNASDLLTIDLSGETADYLKGAADLVASRDGAIDGLGGWFTSELVPGIAMSNSPLDDQAIRREQIFLPFDDQLELRGGDLVRATIGARHDTAIIAWTAHNFRTGERRSHSTWRSQILAEADLIPAGMRVPQVSPLGLAAQVVVRYIDGQRTARAIEDAVIRNHPHLLPSEEEIRRFIRSELARMAK